MRVPLVGAFLVYVWALSSVGGARILVLAPYGTKSHHNAFVPLTKALTERGHHATVITNYQLPELKTMQNVREIAFESLALDLSEYPNQYEMHVRPKLSDILKTVYTALSSFITGPPRVTGLVYQDPRVKEIMANEHFDLAIVCQSTSIASYPLVWHFKVPMILVSPNMLFPGVASALGDEDHLSYAPFLFTHFSDRMSLFQRTANTLISELFRLIYHQWNQQRIRSMVSEMGVADCPPLHEIEKNTSLVFINTHPTFNYPRALPPQVIEVGATHCRPARALPPDLESFVSSSEDGFILFAIGSLLKMEEMPEYILNAFIQTFAQLPQRVIWQWRGTPRSDLPANILPMSWLPQQDLLGHKRCRAFLTHGGLNSLQEAVYHGVPMLGLPFGTDQFLNLNRASKSGYAIRLDWKDVNRESLTDALDQLLRNDSYISAVKSHSSLFHDQTETPIERAVFWTEYVMRHKGADHLRLGSRELTPLQRSLTDVYVILLSTVLAPLILIFALLRRFCHCQV